MTMAKRPAAKTKEVAVVEAEVIGRAIQSVTPMDLIQQAQDKGSSIEQMAQLFDLQLRYEENESKKAYHKAVAAFKSEGIVILKDKNVSYKSTNYNHASIGNALAQIIPCLSKHGLSHSWDVNQEGGQIKVTCKLAHELGHFTEVSMSAGKDDTGQKNAIQQVASTVTYLQRYTLFAITGLAAQDQDDDAIGSEAPPVEYITESQVMDIDALLMETAADDMAYYQYLTIKCKVMIEDASQIPAELFSFAVKILEAKRSK